MVSSITKPLPVKRSVICSLQKIELKTENTIMFSAEACLKTVNVMVQVVVNLLHCYRGKKLFSHKVQCCMNPECRENRGIWVKLKSDH